MQVCVIDDSVAALRQARRLLSAVSNLEVRYFADPVEALSVCIAAPPRVMLVDLCMPALGGIVLIERYLAAVGVGVTYIAVITGSLSAADRRKALELGAIDVIGKPLPSLELGLKVRNMLAHRGGVLSPHTEPRQEVGNQSVALALLEKVAAMRDDTTGDHLPRMAAYAGIIARWYGLTDAASDVLRAAAPLHDIGKVAVPDAILQKPGPLTPNERAVMQLHAEAGHRLLADAPDGVLALGAEIALSHHERWDGKGYPRGLSGEAIPVSARIVAVADVFDALTTQRPYKHAWSIQQAVDYIKANAGSHFDPRVVEALQRGLSDVLLAKAAFDARVACAAAATAGLAE